MTTEKIKEYLEMALDMEKNKYIQEKVIQKMEDEIDSLGHKKRYESPERYTADVSFGLFIGITALIVGFIAFMISMVIGFESSSGMLDSLSAPFQAIKPALIWAVIGGIVGGIIALCKRASEQSEYDERYEQSLSKYNALIERDNDRVKGELQKRESLIEQYKTLCRKYEDSCDKLENFYAYDVVEFRYRDFVSIASLYQYFCEKRTYSLGFNPETGDQGAYNIYNAERRQDMIIDKLDVIAEKLDTVIENQRIIANTLREANNRISSLSSSIKSGFKRMEGAINNQTAVIQYNSERQLAEQKYLNTLATWSYMDSQTRR